jgi:protein-S-isoprenylcysteine O-methyltransferase Ste14
VKSGLLVAVQLLAVAFILLTRPPIARHPLWGTLELCGFLLMLWSVSAMRLRNLHILPDVAPNTTLATSGPYRLIRHPIYSGLLLVTFSLVSCYFSVDRLAAFSVLLVVLLLKLHYEETLLLARFPEYSVYRQKTKRLIPFLY